MESREFWDRKHAGGIAAGVHGSETATHGDPVVARAHSFFGDLRGRRLLDIGCGAGDSALYFARQGARVVAIDSSSVAIERLRERARAEGLVDFEAHALSAQRIAELGRFDRVFGALILHHVEPFAEFAAALRRAVADDGRAFFFENSANSRLLIWFRRNVVGRLWVPKYSDPDEFPLTPDEVDALRRFFTVERRVTELVFVRLASAYLLREVGISLFARIDDWLYRFPRVRALSYTQDLLLVPRSDAGSPN